ncbi:FAD/NAD(P)-binding domain-containing protein [Suhomyces tanzawaensis NRRL Y-17324]|uniref:FAD/NAD(P)-binding domain-containing protein n=1 Tax=Suhomyces tanzawaensis NRRL Y-17324 TaxID=984487 RepID=A0A1E4SSB7_9ASCO|nr:FAD/NAD(P)-binding domain-containing protein [Suhomyces tanzawaensis NRRL Y-17324]ODV82408.1 FAD/NAD(P)-binding domain-containing protein [Suhomyces tanzawaensis NRRL Y-17324]
MTISSVAIIGAGPAGLVALDALIREEKFSNIRLFERKQEAGGSWVYDQGPPERLRDLHQLSQRQADKIDPIPAQLPSYAPKTDTQRFMDSAVYSYLESNVDAATMQFSEEVFPDTVSANSVEKYGPNTPFRHNTVVKNWIQDLYKRKGYHDHLEFNTLVELASKNASTGKWDLVLRRFGKKKDYLWKESFDALLVANGKFNVPFIPSIPGLQEYADQHFDSVVHTKSYRSREYFRDKRVVVVGAFISAIDTLHDIIPVATLPVISSKKKDTKLTPLYGSAPFKHPHIDNRGQITRVDAATKTVYFDDGTHIDGVDHIIFGTGFSLSFPFLPGLDLSNSRTHGFYQLVSNIDDPTLAIVGCVTGGFTFRSFEWQAVLAARIFAGRAKLPSKEKQREWERERVARKGDNHQFLFIEPEFEEYFEGVREVATNDGPGRKLPKFEPHLVEIFTRGWERKMRRFIQNSYTGGNTKL